MALVAKNIDTGDSSSNHELTKIEADKKKINDAKEKIDKCGYIADRIESMEAKPRFQQFFEKNRRELLKDFYRLGACTNPEAEQFDSEEVCNTLTQYIRTEEKKNFKTGVRLDFFLRIYDRIACAKPENVPEYMKELADAIKDKLEDKLPPVLSPDLAVSKVCEPLLETVNEQKENFKTIANYVVMNRERASRMPQLDIALTAVEQKHEGKLNEAFSSFLGQATSIPIVSCYFVNTEKITALTGLSAAEIHDRRTNALTVIGEIAALLSEDDSEEAKVASQAFYDIAEKLGEVYP